MGLSVNSSSAPDWLCTSTALMALLRAWLIFYLLLLPLFSFVLYVGYRQWKKGQSPPSHSDVFTFHIIGMELVTIAGTSFYSIGVQTWVLAVTQVGDVMFSIGVTGQMFFHGLTCVERYLAVVHPITYLRLKKRGGVRIRNVSIAGVWLLSVGIISLKNIPRIGDNYDKICLITLTFLAVCLVSFCSVSVLCVLIRPGPGENGGDLRRVDQSKRRAFFTMTAIMGVLKLRFVMLVTAYLVTSLHLIEHENACLLSMSAAFFYLPSSLVLPLMFLHRAGQLPKCSMTSCFLQKSPQ